MVQIHEAPITVTYISLPIYSSLSLMCGQSFVLFIELLTLHLSLEQPWADNLKNMFDVTSFLFFFSSEKMCEAFELKDSIF